VLRDEGIYNRDSDTVVAISVEALQAVSFLGSVMTKADSQSFNFFLDTEALEPSAPLVLTKLLASAFTIHGNHFTVLKHLHPNDAQDFHTESIEAAFVKIATYVSQERKASKKEDKGRYARKRAQVLTIFKCLIQLLGPVNGRGALNIKSEMENGLREIGIEVSGNRMWEGYRAYEKRLVLIASKDSNIRAGAARVVEEQEQEQEVDREGTEIGSPTPRATEEVGVELPEMDDEEEVDPAEGMDFDLGDLENGDEEEEGPVTPSNGKRRSVAGSERPDKKSRK
jgi:cohesin complex subunit SA-1/2